MPGIVFYRTASRDRVVAFYTDHLGFEVWLEQDGGCTILRRENLLVGFCDAETTETAGIVTIVVPDEAAVDAAYERLEARAREAPSVNEAFDIYHFFAEDPDGRAVEIQTFRHPIPSLE